MLPKLRRVSSILLERNKSNSHVSSAAKKQVCASAERLSNQSSSSSGRSTEDGSNVYIETLLYIVHVDDIDLPPSDEHGEDIYDAGDEQVSMSSNRVIRRVSKRTTASFNERHRHPTDQAPDEPIYSRPSFGFSNPLRRLNSILKSADKPVQSPSTPQMNVAPLCSSTAKRSSSYITQPRSPSQNNNKNDDDEHERPFPPPPPSFLYDNPQSNADRPPTIRATGAGLTDGFVDDNCHFDLTAPHAELQKLIIAIDGPSKADIQIEVIDTGIYRVFYTCQSPGHYHISLTYDGTHIPGSPYRLRLRTQPVQEQVVPPALPPPIVPTRVHVEPTEFHVNSPCIVTVRPAVPCAMFQAYIQSPQGNLNLPITVHKSAKTESYEIYFVPNTCGNHWLNVSLNHIPMVENPCRLIVRACSSSKGMSASGQGLFNAYTGESSQFFVSKSPGDPSTQSGTFSVGISGPSTVFLDANETEHGYEFHYKPTRSGKYIITIKNGGHHVQGSPFICRVYNKLNESRTVLTTMYETENDLANETTTGTTTRATTSCNSLIAVRPPSKAVTSCNTHVDLDILRSSMTGDALQVCAFGTGLYEAKPRRKASFKIDASQAGPGLLLVGLYSSQGPCERVVTKRIMPSSPGFIYKVSYRARARGQYMLVILFGSNVQHVPGSPYLVLVE